jgi:hypothetical protein
VAESEQRCHKDKLGDVGLRVPMTHGHLNHQVDVARCERAHTR